jgi:nitrite reductase/ring-hydroxylating ferredoxin subunit
VTAAPIAVYRRVVEASLERIWENVLDWEHLPWLHHTTFLDVRLHTADRDGWRALVALAPRDTPAEAEIDVRLDRPGLRYLTRTVAGAGRGTEILTTLDPIAPRATAITVAFAVPGIEPSLVSAVGDAYVRAYTRLWDEDEAMMRRRQTIVERPKPRPASSATADVVRLGPLDALRARLPLVIDLPGRRVRLVAVDGDGLGDGVGDVVGDIMAHDTICPHLGGPLDDAPVEDGCVRCPWHGYRFVVRSGENADARACRLAPAARVEVDPSTGEALLRAR